MGAINYTSLYNYTEVTALKNDHVFNIFVMLYTEGSAKLLLEHFHEYSIACVAGTGSQECASVHKV